MKNCTPTHSPSKDSARPQLIITSPGAAYEWLRDTVGTGHLADLRHKHHQWVCTARRPWRLSGERLAALVNGRFTVLDHHGRPALFPVSAARRAVAAPAELPHLINYYPQRPTQ